jgi:chorismate mutase
MKKKNKLNNKKIISLRKQIDKIDHSLIKLLSHRKKIVLNVIKYKPKNRIVDKERIKNMLIKLISLGKKYNLEKKIISNIWQAIIKSFIWLERKKYK